MFLNDYYLLQLLAVILLFYLSLTSSPFTLWVIGGGLLLALGLLGLSLQLNIFIGFLWVIDLGVGFIFLIFLANLVVFGETKLEITTAKTRKIIYLSFMSVIASIVFVFTPFSYINDIENYMIIHSTLLNYYMILLDLEISQLNLLREVFFYNNAWEFILINYFVLSGLLGLIIFNFIITNVHKREMFTQIIRNSCQPHAPLFIRDQNFIKQQQTSSSIRLWVKTVKIRK